MFGFKRWYYATIDQVKLCRRITDRIVSDMEGMRRSTEEAALRIGDLLVSIVDTATSGNNDLRNQLKRFVRSSQDLSEPAGDDAHETPTISESIETQSQQIAQMITQIQQCFERQMVLARSATEASRKIIDTAQQTSQLMTRSKLLAFNVQIEASRLGGEEGRSISVLGEEMKLFSEDVEKANRIIAESISEFAEEMPKLESETNVIGQTLSDFSARFETEMEDVRRETQSITDLLQTVLDSTEAQNTAILKYSQETLSSLQFQDPVAQGLRRAEHDIRKLQSLIENRDIVDDSLADHEDDVGRSASEQHTAGEVMMF